MVGWYVYSMGVSVMSLSYTLALASFFLSKSSTNKLNLG